MANDPVFDPYHEWLSIPPDSRPVTHYQILGITRTEASQQVIETAALRQSAFIRTFQKGAHAEIAARLLGEIQTARSVLIDPVQRRNYDAKLPVPTPPKPAKAETRPTSKPTPRLAEVAEAEKVEIAAPFERGTYKLNSAQVPVAEVRSPRQRIDTKSTRSMRSAASRHTINLIASLAAIVMVVTGGIVIVRSRNGQTESQSAAIPPSTINHDNKSKEGGSADEDTKRSEGPPKPDLENKPNKEQEPPKDRPKGLGDSKGKDSGPLAMNIAPKTDAKEPTKTVAPAPIDPKAWWASVPRLDGKTVSTSSATKSVFNLQRPHEPQDFVENELLIDAAIRGLSEQDDELVRRALRQLALCEPNHRIAEVFESVDPISMDLNRAQTAMNVLAKWDKEAAFDIIESIVTHKGEPALQSVAIMAMAQLQDPRGIAVIASHFSPKKELRSIAGNALVEFGPAAEATVLAALDFDDARKDSGWCREVIRVLEKVGSEKSIKVLKPIASQTGKNKSTLTFVAARAIKNIERRMEKVDKGEL